MKRPVPNRLPTFFDQNDPPSRDCLLAMFARNLTWGLIQDLDTNLESKAAHSVGLRPCSWLRVQHTLHFSMTDARTTINPVYLVVMAVLLWSTGGLLIKLTSIDAYQVTFFRSLLAALTVLVLTRKDGLKINAFGVLTSVIYALLLFLFVWATKKTTAANAIFLQYTAPIYILILAPFVIGEKFHWRDLITVVVVLLGMSLFFVGQLRLEDYQGNTAALFSGIFLGLYIMLLKHPKAGGGGRQVTGDGRQEKSSDLRSSSINPVIAVIYGNFLLALVTLPSGIAAVPVMTAMDWFAVTFLGVVQIGIAYILFIKGVRGGTRPLDASLIGFIEPLLNPVWVFIFVGERPTEYAVLGGGIIITAIAFHTIRQYARRGRLNSATTAEKYNGQRSPRPQTRPQKGEQIAP